MNLAILSSRFPFDNHEPYLGAEITALHTHFAGIVVAPLRGNRRVAIDRSHGCKVLAPARTLSTIALALRAVLRAPAAAFSAFQTIVREPVALACKVKNLAIFPRALALSEQMYALRIDHVHAYWLSAPATAASIIARMNGIPWSATAHRWDIFENNMLAMKVASAEFIRAISERGKREILKRSGSRDNVHIIRLGSALCIPRDEVAATVLLRDVLGEVQTFRILCAAAFVPVKGHRELIDAFAYAHTWNPDLRLILAGRGPLENEIRSLVADAELDGIVTFRGYVPHAQLIEEMRSGLYHAVALASREGGNGEMEGIPSILVEAMSVGVPCVATTSGSIPELLDSVTGYIAPVNDNAALAEALLKVSIDTQERYVRIKRAFTRARALHAPERFAARFSTLVYNVIGEEVLAS